MYCLCVECLNVCTFDARQHVVFINKLFDLNLSSVKRIQGQTNRIRLPITFPIPNQICQQLQKGVYNLYIDYLIETVCIVAFFAFLRCG